MDSKQQTNSATFRNKIMNQKIILRGRENATPWRRLLYPEKKNKEKACNLDTARQAYLEGLEGFGRGGVSIRRRRYGGGPSTGGRWATAAATGYAIGSISILFP